MRAPIGHKGLGGGMGTEGGGRNGIVLLSILTHYGTLLLRTLIDFLNILLSNSSMLKQNTVIQRKLTSTIAAVFYD